MMEALCLMVQIRRELTRLYEQNLMMITIRSIMPNDVEDSGDSVRDAFKMFRNSLMPFLKKEIAKEEDKLKEALKQEVNRGPLRISAITSPKVASRIRSVVSKELSKSPRWRRKRYKA